MSIIGIDSADPFHIWDTCDPEILDDIKLE